MKLKLLSFVLVLATVIVAVSGVTAATAASFGGLGSLPQLAWDLFYAIFGFAVAIVIMKLIDVATGGALGKFIPFIRGR